MRFAIENNTLIPSSLIQKDQIETLPISSIQILPPKDLNLHFPFHYELQHLLAGKQLLLEDIPFSISVIQEHYENGYVTYRKGIENHQCIRCGNKNKNFFASYPCARCGEECVYCRNCIMMGRVSACTPLISWTGPTPVMESNSDLEWTGTLSDGQQVASDKVVAAVEANTDLLVWAVCGAGKTEVLFKGIERALASNKRVCVATPRTDVVLELTPRFKRVFPKIPVASLYGGSEDRNVFAPLTISTTHQLQRFYKAFDTMVVDEVDAFPYSVDASLQYAVEHARKEKSSILYLTATPNDKWMKECHIGKRPFVTIPARFHRYPLPVPKFTWCGNWIKGLVKGKLPLNVLHWLQQRIEKQTPTLFFIPKISLIDKILPPLQQLDSRIESVHAEDPLRKEKVLRMREEKIPLLVTTTILERGVTFPNLDVAVLGAEDRIFTESALVQIAGRVGRNPNYPTGDVTFFHYGKTNAMVKAKKQIQWMNEEARKKGMILY